MGVILFQNILATALLVIFVSSTEATALAATPVCKSKTIDGITTDFCFQKPDTESDTLLVFFHGIYGNEKKWFNDSKFTELSKTMKSKGLTPWVVTISYGGTWLLTETNTSKQLFHHTMDLALPAIIQDVHPEAFAKKFLMGYSMGGLNASQVLLKRPELFDKYVLISPAITPVGPFSNKEEVKDYIKRTEAVPFLINMLINIGHKNFKTQEEWDQHSPLVVVAKQARTVPPVYLSAGNHDQYGFDEGSNLFSLAIAPFSSYSVWMPVPNGDHMDLDAPSVTDFLLH